MDEEPADVDTLPQVGTTKNEDLQLESVVRVKNSSNSIGVIRFVGTTEFGEAGIQWAGIELEDATGKNDGMVAGVRYFQCRHKHGIFVPVERVDVIVRPHPKKKKAEVVGATPASSTATVATNAVPGAATTSSLLASPIKSPVKSPTRLKRPVTAPAAASTAATTTHFSRRSEREKSQLDNLRANDAASKIKVGSRVRVKETLEGTVLFLGAVSFAEGVWAGVALETPEGKNNGSVNGETYFECAENHGLFIRPNLLQLRILKAKAPTRSEKGDERPSTAAATAASTPISSESKVSDAKGKDRSPAAEERSGVSEPAAADSPVKERTRLKTRLFSAPPGAETSRIPRLRGPRTAALQEEHRDVWFTAYGKETPSAPAPTVTVPAPPAFTGYEEKLENGPRSPVASNNSLPSLASASAVDVGLSDVADFDVSMDEGQKWNERFQRLLEMPARTPEERAEKGTLIAGLSQSFLDVASGYVSCIVDELMLPYAEKTIKPVSHRMGGVMGGDKYVHKGIFFKFARDTSGVYGGDDRAAKAAGHEMTGLLALMSCHVPGLHFPLMTLVNYRGHRVVASCVLPISRHTLVYGSADGGCTVHDDSPEVRTMIRTAATQLNLKGHRVGFGLAHTGDRGFSAEHATVQERIMHGCGDLEVHLGKDGRYYVVDTARLFPPEAPNETESGPGLRILYRLLRPELVRANATPLSSDAFSRMGSHDHEVHNAEVRVATDRLLNEVVPALAAALNATPPTSSVVEELGFSDETFHRVGVNLRFMGRVRERLKNHTQRMWIATEASARCFKHILNAALRSTPPDGIPGVVVAHFNALFANLKEHKQSPPEARLESGFWCGNIRSELLERFRGIPDVHDNAHWVKEPAISTHLCLDCVRMRSLIAPCQLLRRCQEMTGVRFLPDVEQRLTGAEVSLTTADLVGVGVVAKRINVIPSVDVLSGSGGRDALSALYDQELKRREVALGPSHPQTVEATLNLADSHMSDGRPKEAIEILVRCLDGIVGGEPLTSARVLQTLGRAKVESNALDDAEKDFLAAIQLLEGRTGIRFTGCLCTIYNELGSLNLSRGKPGLPAAEELLRKAIELAGTHPRGADAIGLVASLNNLALVLVKRGKKDEARVLYERAVKLAIGEGGPDHSSVAMSMNNFAVLLCKDQTKFREAESLYLQVIRIKQKTLGPDHPSVGATFTNLGELYARHGRHAASLAAFQHALFQHSLAHQPVVAAASSTPTITAPTASGAGGGGPPIALSITTTDSAGAALVSGASPVDAATMKMYEAACKAGEQATTPNGIQTAAVLERIGAIHKEMGQLDAAESACIHAIRLRYNLLSPMHPSIASPLSALAEVFMQQGKFAQAQQAYTYLVTIAEATAGPELSALSGAMSGLAYAYCAQGNFASAEPLYDYDAHVTELAYGPHHPAVTDAINNLGACRFELGKRSQAESTFLRALATTNKARRSNHLAAKSRALNNLGVVRFSRGEAASAETLLKRSLFVAEKVLGADHPALASPLTNLGMLYVATNQLVLAEAMLRQALTLRTRHSGRHHPSTLATLSVLVELHVARGDIRAARSIAAEVMTATEASLPPTHPSVASAANNLGATLMLEDLPHGVHAEGTQAAAAFSRALGIKEGSLGLLHPSTAISIENLALASCLGQPSVQPAAVAEAITLMERSLDIEQQTLGANHVSVGITRNNMGVLEELRDNFTAARRQYVEAAALAPAMTPNLGDTTIVAAPSMPQRNITHLNALEAALDGVAHSDPE